ncbi:peptidoglycan-binding protein [Streptomyces sp. NPDC059720]|uniref:peptidoglycan-binding domain-containing protein n=1 Tax=Streptomyces sp. NPDC059720 TaxID=3346924 RepID=UPI00367B61FF
MAQPPVAPAPDGTPSAPHSAHTAGDDVPLSPAAGRKRRQDASRPVAQDSAVGPAHQHAADPTDGGASPRSAHTAAAGRAPAPSPAETTLPLGPVGPAAVPPGPAADPDATTVLPTTAAPAPAGPDGPADTDATTVLPATDATAVLPAAQAASVVPAPLVSGGTEPSVADLRLFDSAGAPGPGAPEPEGTGPRRAGRRRRAAMVAAAAAGVAVVAAAGYASGLFSYESPSRDTALPDDLRASVPDVPASSVDTTPSKGTSAPASSAPATPSPSRTGSPSASPSPSASSASPSPSQSPSPSAPRTSASASATGQAQPESGRRGGATVLRLGDRGPEVTELQLRLRQLYLYSDNADGFYSSRLEDAVRTYQWSRGIRTQNLGIYDEATRAGLESETREP